MKKAFGIIFLVAFAITAMFIQRAFCASSDEVVKLFVGEPWVVSVNGLARIAIGNPAVIDVGNVSKNELTVNPKIPGTTTFVFWDLYGEQSYRVKVFAEDIQEAKRRIDNLLSKLDFSGVHTQAEEDEGKVLLLGEVKTIQDKDKISLVLGALKSKTVDLINIKELETAVEIDVQVLELSKDASSALGLTNPLSSTITISEVNTPALTGVGWAKLFNVLDVKRGAFVWTLDALVKEGKARVLSRPRLACQSGKEAELSVGGEKPTFTTEVASAGGSGTSVEYKEYGIKLKIKPTITGDDRIKVALNVDISEVGAVETLGTATETTAKAYPLTKRTISTELYLNDGQTLAVGGLVKQKEEEDITKTPWFGDIPIFGLLFRKKTTSSGGGDGERGNMELFVTLTPKIVGRQVAEAIEAKNIAEAKNSISSTVADLDQNVPENIKKYAAIVQKRILDNLGYPSPAKDAGFQGTVKLGLHLSYTGELLDTVIRNSSGYNVLDENAILTARRIISFPPFPESVDKKDLWIDIPITYNLD
ncbi:MAG: TonB family protein [Candidatus Omnitrophica bacterium]|jgi:pilus assembly protein CpaC|nr:TonB family protein [Candidatus Omnitrophota bacterium]